MTRLCCPSQAVLFCAHAVLPLKYAMLLHVRILLAPTQLRLPAEEPVCTGLLASLGRCDMWISARSIVCICQLQAALPQHCLAARWRSLCHKQRCALRHFECGIIKVSLHIEDILHGIVAVTAGKSHLLMKATHFLNCLHKLQHDTACCLHDRLCRCATCVAQIRAFSLGCFVF